METSPDLAPWLDPVQGFTNLRQWVGRTPGPIPVENLKVILEAQGTGDYIQPPRLLQGTEQVPGEGILAIFTG